MIIFLDCCCLNCYQQRFTFLQNQTCSPTYHKRKQESCLNQQWMNPTLLINLLQLKQVTDLWHFSYVIRSRLLSAKRVLDTKFPQVFFRLFAKERYCDQARIGISDTFQKNVRFVTARLIIIKGIAPFMLKGKLHYTFNSFWCISFVMCLNKMLKSENVANYVEYYTCLHEGNNLLSFH